MTNSLKTPGQSSKSAQWTEKLRYFGFSLLHPFEGFYDIRFRGKGSMLLALISLFIYGVVKCCSYQYTGFIMNLNDPYEMNSVSVFLSSTLIVVLFAVSNWTVTTLFGGKGNMASIFTVLCYSLAPLSAINLLVIFLSNYIILDEAMIVNMLSGIGIVWFVFLVISGFCVIHEYGLFRNLASLVITFVAAFLIVFIMVLFLTLEEKMFGFFGDVIREFIRRTTLN